MAYVDPIKGDYVTLKTATIEDAEFTLKIRQDPEFIEYLPQINCSLEQQKRWIESQKNNDDTYFFVVWNENNSPIGTISIYDLNSEKPQSGRVAIKGNALQCLEAQYLIFAFAFQILNLEQLYGFIFAGNARAIRFSKFFDAVFSESVSKENGKCVREVYYTKENFYETERKIKNTLYRGKR